MASRLEALTCRSALVRLVLDSLTQVAQRQVILCGHIVGAASVGHSCSRVRTSVVVDSSAHQALRHSSAKTIKYAIQQMISALTFALVKHTAVATRCSTSAQRRAAAAPAWAPMLSAPGPLQCSAAMEEP